MQVKDLVLRYSHLGVKKIAQNGTELVGAAPFIAPEAWPNSLYAPLSQAEITQIENELACPIPSSYKSFLLQVSNGLDILCNTFYLYGFRRDYNRNGIDIFQPYSIIDFNRFEKPGNSKTGMFFIGGYNWDGSHIYIYNDLVCYCSKNDSTPLKTWKSLNEMIVSEIERLYSLHDSNGRPLDETIPTTPQL